MELVPEGLLEHEMIWNAVLRIARSTVIDFNYIYPHSRQEAANCFSCFKEPVHIKAASLEHPEHIIPGLPTIFVHLNHISWNLERTICPGRDNTSKSLIDGFLRQVQRTWRWPWHLQIVVESQGLWSHRGNPSWCSHWCSYWGWGSYLSIFQSQLVVWVVRRSVRHGTGWLWPCTARTIPRHQWWWAQRVMSWHSLLQRLSWKRTQHILGVVYHPKYCSLYFSWWEKL